MRFVLPLKTYAVLVSISFLMVLADRMELLDPPKGAIQTVLLPVQQGLGDWVVGGHRIVSGVVQMWDAQKRYEHVLKEYTLLLAQHQKTALLEEENRKLHVQLGSFIARDKKLIPARIIMRSPDIMLDRGKVDGITEGMAVVLGDVLIGNVSQVGPKQSRLLLVSDADSKIMVEVENTKQKGVVEGRYNTGMRLSRMLQDVALREHQVLLTTGDDGLYPRGLSVGKITKVYSKESALFQEADVVALLPIDQVDLVFILVER